MASSSELESRAKEAFMDDDFALALDLYTQAIAVDSGSPALYADRAQAHIKLGNLTDAVADANKAIELDPSMAKAYLRKGSACIKLEAYQTAKAALEVGSSLAPTDRRFSSLLKECNDRISEECTNGGGKIATDLFDSIDSSEVISKTRRAASVESPDHEPAIEALKKPKYRHEFYNAQSEVVVTVYAKSVPPEHVTIDFGEQILSLSIEIPGEEAYHLQTRLFGKIIPDKCNYRVSPAKVEIHLAKAEFTTWTSLEYIKANSRPQNAIAAPAVKVQRPSYPSSKSKTDWDKIEAEVKKEEKEEKLDGDAAVNKLFQNIFRDGDEDMRRAMVKSFVESNGTVLSTNWKEVGAKKVEESPPDGMELKRWEH